MVEVLERDTVGDTIEATVNYIVNNGEKLFTETAGRIMLALAGLMVLIGWSIMRAVGRIEA